ncbi:putative DNA-binding domain-containing protein [Celeribacter sp.]|uniref:HvfC/BufC family peptide modification chaperone n=1 Tax=Celeribacter sp. TaxID=1890673 RepID=UPI003A929AD2
MKQQEFLQAALAPEAPIPAGLITPSGAPAQRRFDVYRNNIIVGLKEAIAASYPAVKSLVGDAFFDAMTGEYVRTHPPKTPILPLYGADFAEFIDDFAPASRLPYLADVARLEYALRQSYHAADTRPVPAAEFSDPLLFTRHVVLAPTVIWFASAYPVTKLRRFALDGDRPSGGAEDVLITRPAYDPIATAFPPGTIAVLDALRDGMALANAAELAPSDLDLSQFLGTLLKGGAIIDILEGEHDV